MPSRLSMDMQKDLLVKGWIDAQGLKHELIPPLGRCMKVQGKECRYTLKSSVPFGDGGNPSP